MAKATGPLYRVQFRRRREGVTDYDKRLALLKSGEARAVVRKTNRRVIVQFVAFAEKGDKTLVSASSLDLSAVGYNKANTSAAYLVGYLAARKAKKAGISKAVADFGRQSVSKGNVLFAALKGIKEGGVDIAFDEGLVPAGIAKDAKLAEAVKKIAVN